MLDKERGIDRIVDPNGMVRSARIANDPPTAAGITAMDRQPLTNGRKRDIAVGMTMRF